MPWQCHDGMQVTITNSTLLGNMVQPSAHAPGGAIHMSGDAQLDCEDSFFADNAAGTDGGAISVSNLRFPALVANTNFHRNTAVGSHGGAIYADSVSVMGLTACTFTACHALGGSGGALFARGFEQLLIANTTAMYCQAAGPGGAIMLVSSSAETLAATGEADGASGSGIRGLAVMESARLWGNRAGALSGQCPAGPSNAACTEPSAPQDLPLYAAVNETLANMSASLPSHLQPALEVARAVAAQARAAHGGPFSSALASSCSGGGLQLQGAISVALTHCHMAGNIATSKLGASLATTQRCNTTIQVDDGLNVLLESTQPCFAKAFATVRHVPAACKHMWHACHLLATVSMQASSMPSPSGKEGKGATTLPALGTTTQSLASWTATWRALRAAASSNCALLLLDNLNVPDAITAGTQGDIPDSVNQQVWLQECQSTPIVHNAACVFSLQTLFFL